MVSFATVLEFATCAAFANHIEEPESNLVLAIRQAISLTFPGGKRLLVGICGSPSITSQGEATTTVMFTDAANVSPIVSSTGTHYSSHFVVYATQISGPTRTIIFTLGRLIVDLLMDISNNTDANGAINASSIATYAERSKVFKRNVW